jgi:hypothetical protein
VEGRIILKLILEEHVIRFNLRGRKWREAGEDCIMRSFITCTLHQILLG